MTAALEGGKWSAARPGCTLPRERFGTHFTGGWVGPRAGLDGRKLTYVYLCYLLHYSLIVQCIWVHVRYKFLAALLLKILQVF